MSTTTYDTLEQGSEEWLQARCGMLTASVIGKFITPTLKVANNDTSRAAMNTLAAERITGHVDYVHPSFDMIRGTEDEPYARDYYREHYAPVDELGFIVRTENDYTLGYSPDGLVGDDGLIEIKSRRPNVQIGTLLSGSVPAANMAQMQAGMFVTGRAWCDYISFSAGLPLFVKRVHADNAWQAVIEQAATEFEAGITEIIDRYNTTDITKLVPTERRASIEEITF